MRFYDGMFLNHKLTTGNYCYTRFAWILVRFYYQISFCLLWQMAFILYTRFPERIHKWVVKDSPLSDKKVISHLQNVLDINTEHPSMFAISYW